MPVAHPIDRDLASPHRVARVRAPARLHLGFIDPAASLGRRFGSIGLVVDDPATVLSMRPAERDAFTAPPGHDLLDRLARHLDTLRRATGRRDPLAVDVETALRSHAGLGSGTQLALAVGHAFSRCFGLALTTADVVRLLGRGKRSGIGAAGFERGGFIVDGGPAPEGRTAAPVLFRADFPADWRVLLVQDEAATGLHGDAEAKAIEGLPSFAREKAARISHELLMRVLPSLLEARFEPFAAGIAAIQKLIGEHFAPAQGGDLYTSPAVGRLLRWVADRTPAGIGQSSWGPTGFALLPTDRVAQDVLVAARAAGMVDAGLSISIVRGLNRGALAEPAAATRDSFTAASRTRASGDR